VLGVERKAEVIKGVCIGIVKPRPRLGWRIDMSQCPMENLPPKGIHHSETNEFQSCRLVWALCLYQAAKRTRFHSYNIKYAGIDLKGVGFFLDCKKSQAGGRPIR